MTQASSVLVIEDDSDVRLAISSLLTRAGLEPRAARDGREGLRLLYELRPDCVVLDIGLPDLDGWTILERIRDMSDVPVLLLTARNLEVDKVRGLHAGADDYMTKPFGNQELVARVHAVLRRARGRDRSDRHEIYADHVLTLDPARRSVEIDGKVVGLTPLEFRLLHTLIRSSPHVLSPEQLLERAWNDPTATAPERVKYSVHRLRRKLGFGDHGSSPIEAVRGFGYRYQASHQQQG